MTGFTVLYLLIEDNLLITKSYGLVYATFAFLLLLISLRMILIKYYGWLHGLLCHLRLKLGHSGVFGHYFRCNNYDTMSHVINKCHHCCYVVSCSHDYFERINFKFIMHTYFAGLKILRCCDHCDIVGTIKGSKEFKGAHWHCYR